MWLSSAVWSSVRGEPGLESQNRDEGSDQTGILVLGRLVLALDGNGTPKGKHEALSKTGLDSGSDRSIAFASVFSFPAGYKNENSDIESSTK